MSYGRLNWQGDSSALNARYISLQTVSNHIAEHEMVYLRLTRALINAISGRARLWQSADYEINEDKNTFLPASAVCQGANDYIASTSDN